MVVLMGDSAAGHLAFLRSRCGVAPQQQEEGMGLDEVVKLGGIGFCVVALMVLNVGVL